MFEARELGGSFQFPRLNLGLTNVFDNNNIIVINNLAIYYTPATFATLFLVSKVQHFFIGTLHPFAQADAIDAGRL